MVRRIWVALAALALVGIFVAGATAFLLAARPAPLIIVIHPPSATATPVRTPTPSVLSIYITGAVRLPGAMLSMPPGMRVEHAVAAAGGLTADADINRINLARLLEDGEQIHIPRVGELVSADATGALMRINIASATELMTLPGIGEVLAARIIAYRSANGWIDDIDELSVIDGISDGVIEQIRPLIRFD